VLRSHIGMCSTRAVYVICAVQDKLHELQGLVARRQELDQDLRDKQGDAQAESERAVQQEQEALQQQAALEQEVSRLQSEIDKLKSQIQAQTHKP
jgi:predicted nuclease with TOPRIM domain